MSLIQCVPYRVTVALSLPVCVCVCVWQVTKLLKKVKDLGGTMERDRPISPPPMPDISQNAFLQGTSDQGKRLSELEVENAALKQRISR